MKSKGQGGNTDEPRHHRHLVQRDACYPEPLDAAAEATDQSNYHRNRSLPEMGLPSERENSADAKGRTEKRDTIPKPVGLGM
jgi:hypothetical protein